MKILLVRPPVPKHTIGLKHIMICEPLELEYVAAGLDGHEIRIFDMILEKNLGALLREFKPDIMGTSSYISGVNEVIKVCRQVKLWNRECFTIVGGVQAAQVSEDFADNSIDIIIKGDGTSQVKAVVDAFINKEDFTAIPGLAIPQRKGAVFHTEGKSYMPPADELPLPRRDLVAHLQDQYYYLMHRPVATMKTTWGCWYKCNFCYTWRITDGNPYSRSPESIVKELLTIRADDVYIVDDIFLIKPSRLQRLAELIRENNIKKKFLVYARADFIAANEDIIHEWAGLGLTAVFIGLEAVTDDELTRMNKESEAVNNMKAIKVLQRNGIDVYGSLIPQPEFTVEDWKRLRRFVDESGLYYLNISPLVPLPGTSVYEMYKDELIVPREAHGLWDLSHAVVKTKMPLRQYYYQLLITYASVVYNVRRAKRVTQRTLPSIWSWRYIKLLWGTTKIGWQFINAHRHHTKKQLNEAMYEGPALDMEYSYQRLGLERSPLNQELRSAV
jgi:radical SAM superfamily enzyme YgiQ (UPF0313 family)